MSNSFNNATSNSFNNATSNSFNMHATMYQQIIDGKDREIQMLRAEKLTLQYVLDPHTQFQPTIDAETAMIPWSTNWTP